MLNPLETLRRWRHTVVPLPVKYGRRFRQVFRFLLEHQHRSRAELEAYQWQRLKALLEYAYHHVPFYHRRFDAIGLRPEDIKSPADFVQVPTLRREEVVECRQELKSDEIEQLDPLPSVTSGTTRDQMKFYRSRETEVWRRAVVWRHYFNLGYRFREPRAELLCPLPFLKDNREMPVDYRENALLIDPTSISREHCPRIHARLREFAPKMFFTHPGTATSLAEEFRGLGLAPLPIPLIVCTGEAVYPEYRAAIEEFFPGRIARYYANRENTVAACELADGNMYLQSEYCFLEFLDDDEQPVENEQANIVSTSLVNYAFPFIRYHTDDVGRYCGYPTDAKLNLPVMEILGGRGKDLLLTRTGLRCTYMSTYSKRRGFDRYRRIQLIQPSLDELIVRVVPTSRYRGDEDSELLRTLCREEFGDNFSVKVELVDGIPPTGACKNKMVVSQPAIDYLRSRQNNA
ncbi:MAG: hypothetical protein ABIJ61_01765 [bacterium]